MSKGITIAGRYAAVRRQFANQDGTKIERKLIDYQTHMYKIAPLVSYCYAMHFIGKEILDMFINLQEDIKTGDFKLLDILHHLSAGFKATLTKVCYEGLDAMRQACGGAGFLAWSALPQLVADYSPATTFEGDNTVLS